VVNLVRYDVKASPLQERGVPIIVPHVVELVMGSRTKKGQFLQGQFLQKLGIPETRCS
jgi:hypothetical protein